MKNNTGGKLMVVFLILVLVGIFWVYDLDRFLTLSYLKESQARFADFYGRHRLLVVSVYVIIYVLVTALSLPGAAVMTLAGGGIFGLWLGLVVVSFASTIGATLACIVSRFLMRDWVQSKFGDKLASVNLGIAEEGKFYLFTLRLVPVFPFFVINLIMGLTKMPLLTYYWVSQVGMLPGTLVYVNVGKELTKIDKLSGILSPGLIASFALLGVFPLLIRKGVNWYKKRK